MNTQLKGGELIEGCSVKVKGMSNCDLNNILAGKNFEKGQERILENFQN